VGCLAGTVNKIEPLLIPMLVIRYLLCGLQWLRGVVVIAPMLPVCIVS